MVDGAALEKRSPRIAERGFESHPLRHQGELWRGAGVAYQARLESACRLWRPWVRIPPSPLPHNAARPLTVKKRDE